MSRDSLDSFLHQLADWTRQIIDTGRTPFRKVEIAPPLLLHLEQTLPHMVLWINRDSHMAGGLILLPDGNTDQATACGAELAAALGLKNFACWDRRQIDIWELADPSPSLRESLPLADVRSAGQFRKHHRQLLERLKVLSVVNAPDRSELAADHLANLLHLALLDVAPGLEEILRARHPELKGEWNGGRRPGLAKALLTICRLLAVGHSDLLPATVVADGLERAVHFACSNLPEEVAPVLAQQDGEPPLPPEASARMHHVWRRLQQLDCLPRGELLAAAAARLQESVSELQEICIGREGPPTVPGELRVYPVAVPEASPSEAEVAIPAVLAWRSLLRWLQGIPQPRLHATGLADLDPGFRPHATLAAFSPSAAPPKAERARLETALRLVWPSRRFGLPASTPRWQYDLLQVLGRTRPGGKLELHTPADWLDGAAPPVWELLRSDFCLQALKLEDNGSLQLDLLRDGETDATCSINSSSGERRLNWSQLRNRSSAYLRVLLHWPDELLHLVDQDLLRLTTEHPLPAELEAEAYAYHDSCWGRRLTDWCQLAGLDTDRTREAVMACYPHPDRLRRLGNRAADLPAGSARHDAEIALWIGNDLADDNWSAAPATRLQSSSKGRPSLASLVAKLESLVLADGRPSFPEHYLYDHYRPRLGRFELHAPLQEAGQFFGQITLRDRDGREIQAESPALAGCLLLASNCRSGEVELPLDAEVATAILRKYLTDLQDLRARLEEEARRLVDDEGNARRLVSKAWKNWRMPDAGCIRRARELA